MRTTEQRNRSAVENATATTPIEKVPAVAERLAPAQFASSAEETLVVDDRNALRPAQAVERRLTRALGNGALGVSHLQTRSLLGSRVRGRA